MSYFTKALNILRSSNDKMTLRDFYANMASYHTENKNYPEALADYKNIFFIRQYHLRKNTVFYCWNSHQVRNKEKRWWDSKAEYRSKNKATRDRETKGSDSGEFCRSKAKRNEIILLSQQRELQDAKISSRAKNWRNNYDSKKWPAAIKIIATGKTDKCNELKVQKQLRDGMIGAAIALALLAGFIFNVIN